MPNKLDKLFAEHGSLSLTPTGLRLMHAGEFATESAAKSTLSRHSRDTYAPYQHSLLRYARLLVTFRRVVNGVATGKAQHHLFDAVGDAEGDRDGIVIALPSLDTIRETLEHGLNGVGSGWGEVEIDSVELVPVPVPLAADPQTPPS